MKFSGPDLVPGKFEVNATVVSKNVFSKDVLEQAATRLLAAWPMLSFRVNTLRTYADETPATSIHDGFFSVQTIDQSILPSLNECGQSGDIDIYDAQVVHELFGNGAQTWTDFFRPRILVIQAAILQDATVLKFTVQHAAGDATAIYNAAAAFCEGLHGEVQTRSSRANVDYKMIDTQAQQKAKAMTGRLSDAINTPQARAYWQWCTGNILFPIATIIRKWLDYRRTPARWQTVYFPQHILDGWKHAAEDEALKVSTFDLFSSWLHMNMDDYSRTLDPKNPAKLAFMIRVKEFFANPKQGIEEFWNPLSVGIASNFPRSEDSQQSRLLAGAVNVRRNINEVREPAYRADYAHLMEHAGERQGQPDGFGNRTPALLVLTSWSHAPLHSLQMWSEEHHEHEPVFVQPLLHLMKPLPVPDGMDRQFGICWQGKNGGYWFSAAFADDLWRRVLDVSSRESIGHAKKVE